MNCPSCGAHVSEDKRFCDECGTALPIVCSVCGGINRAEAKFCGDCGTHLTLTLVRRPGDNYVPQSRRQTALYRRPNGATSR
jgi:predicted amidophosphoribosyltransferase